MHEAGAALLSRAQQVGAVRPEVGIADLLRLVHGITLTADPASTSVEQTDRLLTVVLDGLRRPQS
jgi:hypothetical protein